MPRSRAAIVGAFVLGGLALFALGLFLIGDRRLLFVKQYELFTRFTKVTGIQIGTQVRVGGLPAGEVTEVLIPPGPSEKFRVRMRLRGDLQQLVRTDSYASILTDGIVGNTFIQIEGGTDQAPVAEPGSTINGRDPIEFADLIQEGRDTFRLVTREILDLRRELSGAIDVLKSVLTEANSLLVEAGGDIKVITSNARRVSEDLTTVSADTRAMVGSIRAGEGSLGKLITRDDIWNSASRITADAERTMANVQDVSAQLREAVERFRAKDGPADRLVADLQAAVSNAREVMADLADSTEAAKRSFLLRGFFESRGFFDLDAMTLDEYRRFEQGERDRVPLRVWIEAEALFGEGEADRPRLTDAGRRRLDVTMGDFLRYPRDSILVVEGYSTASDPTEQYVISDARARAVQQYLQGRFRRNANLVGSVAGGLVAPGSPRGNERWDGVALTLFVRKEHLRNDSSREAGK
ncbi:MAG TPA: MlaD family protein [Vicinamibacterales bacterium]